MRNVVKTRDTGHPLLWNVILPAGYFIGSEWDKVRMSPYVSEIIKLGAICDIQVALHARKFNFPNDYYRLAIYDIKLYNSEHQNLKLSNYYNVK